MTNRFQKEDIVKFLYLGEREDYDSVSCNPGMTDDMYDFYVDKWLGCEFKVTLIDVFGYIHLDDLSSRKNVDFIFSPNWLEKTNQFEFDDKNII